jgi:hypothetical protein
MLVPTAPVRKITSACDIWTDQTRNRTSTTVEFCIAKMMPNRSRIPPRISLNLVVMFFLVSLSRWEVTPRTLKGAAFKCTACGSSNSRPGSCPARVSSTRRCAGACRSNRMPDPRRRGQRSLHAVPGAHVDATRRASTRFPLDGIPHSNFVYWPRPTKNLHSCRHDSPRSACGFLAAVGHCQL